MTGRRKSSGKFEKIVGFVWISRSSLLVCFRQVTCNEQVFVSACGGEKDERSRIGSQGIPCLWIVFHLHFHLSLTMAEAPQNNRCVLEGSGGTSKR